MNAKTEAWLEFAQNDLKTIKHIIDDAHLTNVVVFHAQQCVEKCFKAVVIAYDLELKRIHDLLKLHAMIEDYVNIDIDVDRLEALNEVYTDARYPVDVGLLPDGKPSQVRAKEFYEFA